MRASLFNVPVPLSGCDEVFVMNTFTDAQALVSQDVADLLDRLRREDVTFESATAEEREAITALSADGFIVDTHERERADVRAHLTSLKEDTAQLRVTVLTTLQCNFACDYCVQGDHGDVPAGQRMTLETAARTMQWIEKRLDTVRPESFVLTFFGGEPLLNLPVVYQMAEQAAAACKARNVRMLINIITNGLLLTPEVVDRLMPFGLNGVKITLDGAKELHDKSRPLRGGQGTFDRIVKNISNVAGKCRVAIGGNFEDGAGESFIELLDFLKSQDFAPFLDKVAFKPVIRQKPTTPKGFIPLTAVGDASSGCGSSARIASTPKTNACDTCHFVDEQMIALREATSAHGFRTVDGVHMGPCELHRQHAHTIGPDGVLFACPGFAGDAHQAVGDIRGTDNDRFRRAAAEFAKITSWRESCGDCSYVPVCGGGCSVAAHAEQGSMHAASCHKTSFEAGVAAFARAFANDAANQPPSPA